MGGGKSTTTGYNYFGSFAVAICIGPVKRLLRIANGDTDIFTGPVDATSADLEGKTTLSTTIGVIDFYWGTASQLVNAALDSLEIDLGTGKAAVPMPAFRRLCYAVCRDVAFGSQTTPPTLRFDVQTELASLPISQHSINGDAVIPEAAYEYLTNTLYGAALPPSALDTQSFIDAAETTIAEGVAASPSIDTVENVRDTVGRMLACIDGFLCWEAGKIKLKLTRPDAGDHPVLDESDLLDEPEPINKLLTETWNVTRVTFRDRENKWEETPELYADAANSSIAGRVVPKDFEFPWITRREVAKIVAKRLGLRGGIPPVYWSLRLKPMWRTLSPGQVFLLSWSKLGITERLCRVTEVHYGSAADPAVTVQCIEDQTRDASHDYVPPEDLWTVPGTLDGGGLGAFPVVDATPRLSVLPEALLDGAPDGVLVAMSRPDAYTTSADLWWSYNPEAFAFQRLTSCATFPVTGTLRAWWAAGEGRWRFRVTMASQTDYDTMIEMVKEADLLCVVGQRDFKTAAGVVTKSEHQVLAPWLIRPTLGAFVPVSADTFDIELQGGQFGTPDLLLETEGADGRYPTTSVYFGVRESFLTYTSLTLNLARPGANAADDTDLKRIFRTPTANHLNEQTVTDAAEVVYDRDDTTMCADGTFSRDWGARALTAYEVMDVQGGLKAVTLPAPDYAVVADLDQALGNVFAGTATPTETALVSGIDLVLGLMATTTQQFYNE